MARVFSLSQIKAALPPTAQLLRSIQQCFVDFSAQRVALAQVGHLSFQSEEHPGDACIKSGFVKGGDHFVVKVASGFYNNPKQGLPSCNGVMLVFSQKHGHLEAVLHDEGHLTDLRTALAAAAAAQLLAPPDISCIGVFGTGIIARLALESVSAVTGCRTVRAWARSDASAVSFAEHAQKLGLDCTCSADAASVAAASQVIVTATPSRAPLFPADAVQRNALIIAMGADAKGKQELPAEVVGGAALCVADSRAQCTEFGELSHAVQQGAIAPTAVRELGELLDGGLPSALSGPDRGVVVFDSTGIAAQDVAIAEAVYNALAAAA